MFKPKPLKPVLTAVVFTLFTSVVDTAGSTLKRLKALNGIAVGTYKIPRILRGALLVILVGSSLGSLYLAFATPSQASATTSSYLNFQSRLENATGSIAPDGDYNVEFKLYDTLSSGGTGQGVCTGNCLWMETRTGVDKVHVANGYLTVNLGSVTAFGSINWDQQLYLTMNIGGTGAPSWDGEMSPRIALTAVPYAFQAQSATQLQATAGSFVGTLNFASETGGNQTFQLPDEGAAGTYTLATTSNVFLQGGNSFSGTTAGELGTNNNGVLNFRTNNTDKLQLDTSGNLVFQQASTINVLAAATGTQLKITGGNANSGTNTGGTLLLQGGAGNSTGVSGSVIVKANTNDTTTAFQVQNAAGSSVLTVSTLDLGSWTTNANSLTAVEQAASAISNGYAYVVGGTTTGAAAGGVATVQYAKVNSDGSVGTWSNTSSLLAARSYGPQTAPVWNGYIYYAGGYNTSGTVQSTVYYAKLNADGTVGTWNTTTGLSVATAEGEMIAANGYLYWIGGYNGAADVATSYYAKINADGTVGTWAATGITLPSNLSDFQAVVANGYIYTVGGWTGGADTNDIFTAKLNSNGTLSGTAGNWFTPTTVAGNSLPGTGLNDVSAVVANGNLYAIAGAAGGGGPGTKAVYAFPLPADGSATMGTRVAMANMVANRWKGSAAYANGYVYYFGGDSANGSTASGTVYYTSTTRVSIAGDLDLLGPSTSLLSGQSNGGGNIYSGSIYSVGNLSVQGNTTLRNGLNVNGSVSIRDNANSTATFQVQNSSGSNLLTADTTNNALVVGNDGTTSAITIRGGVASASNTTGSNITFDASNGTGAASSGDFIFRTASPTASAVTFDNSWSTNDGAGGAAHSFTWSSGTPAIASGHSNYLLVVGVTITENSAQTVATVTYNGSSLTKLNAQNCTGTTCRTELWYMVNPTHDGAGHNVVVTLSGAQTANYSIGAASYYNVDQTTPLQTAVLSSGTAGSGGAATFTTNNISTTNTQVVIDALGTDQVVTNPGSQTVLWNNTSIDTAASGSKPGTGGNVNYSWTSNSAHWADVTTAINPVTNATADTLTDRLHITGTGNVGISNSNPQYTLDVTGTGNFAMAVQSPQVQSASATALTLAAGANLVVKTNGTTRATFDTSNNLYLGNGTTAAAPNNFVIQGTGSTTTAVAGGSITLQGGNATVGNANGGNLTLSGGTGFGSGVNGIVILTTPTFQTASSQSCGSNCTVTQANVDSNGAVVINATAASLTVTLPDPTITTAGKVVYVTAAVGSNDFTLTANSGGISITLHQDTTATMVWNGTDWTAAGASNATTLQATYNNGTNPSTVPEIKLDSTHGTIDIQDADSSIGADLFNIRGSNASALGTVLFGVASTGRVTVQNVSDPTSAFRILDASSNYLYNNNANSGYTIDNNTRPVANGIQNPSFESGGNITGGEEGWIGSSQASVVNSAANAHTGNYELQVTANGSTQTIYNGSYYSVKEGDVIYLEGWVKKSAGADGNGGVIIESYDKDKALVSSSSDISSASTSYVLHKITYTVPSGVQYIKVAAKTTSATTGTYYFDDFYMNSSVRGIGLFQNSADSTTAFRIQSAAAAQTLFAADTTDNLLKVGDSTGTDTNTTIFVLDSASANITTYTRNGVSLNGGLYFNSNTNNVEAIIGGATYDVCTTAVTCTGYSASASSSVQLQTGSQPGTTQTGFLNISGPAYTTGVLTVDKSGASTNSDSITIKTGNASGTTSNSGSITIDTGTATGTVGSITIGHSGVTTTMPGNLVIQGGTALTIGTAGTSAGAIVMYSSAAGGHTVTLKANGADPTSNWNLVLPQNPGNAGDCLKDSSGTGALAFSNCTSGATTTLQDTYNNSSSPATITLADGKDIKIVAQDTTTDPNIIFNLQCTTSCSTNGRFAVQNGGTDVFQILPNSQGIVLGEYTQVGSATTDTTQVNFQLDSFSTFADTGTCNATTNQGALYYNTNSNSVRACQDSAWTDVLTVHDMDLLMFGVVVDSGSSNQGDLQALVTAGVSGPCKVSWVDSTHIAVQACVAYSGGRRVVVSAIASLQITGMTTTNIWESLCLTGTNSQPALSSAASSETSSTIYPTFSVTAPVLCLAQIRGSVSTANNISQIFDTRAFSGSQKIPMAASTAVSLSMVADMVAGKAIPSVNGNKEIIGIVNATDGGTSSTSPNIIVTTFGPSEAKAISGTNNAGDFVIQSGTNGYASTHNGIPNNSFNYEMGIPGNAFSSTCSAASNCLGSLFVNFEVR